MACWRCGWWRRWRRAAPSPERWRWRWWLLSAVCCGLGLLTKGPVALALVVPPVTAWMLLGRFRFAVASLVLYIAIAVAVAAPWYAAVALHSPAAAADFFWQHNVQRFVVPFDHVKPFWFYLPLVFTGTLPWSLLLLPLAQHLFTPFRTNAASADRLVFLVHGVWLVSAVFLTVRLQAARVFAAGAAAAGADPRRFPGAMDSSRQPARPGETRGVCHGDVRGVADRRPGVVAELSPPVWSARPGPAPPRFGGRPGAGDLLLSASLGFGQFYLARDDVAFFASGEQAAMAGTW